MSIFRVFRLVMMVVLYVLVESVADVVIIWSQSIKQIIMQCVQRCFGLSADTTAVNQRMKFLFCELHCYDEDLSLLL